MLSDVVHWGQRLTGPIPLAGNIFLSGTRGCPPKGRVSTVTSRAPNRGPRGGTTGDRWFDTQKMPRSIPNLTENCELQLEYRTYENIRRDFSWDKPGPTARTAYQRLDFFVDWGSDLCVPQPT